MGNFVRSGKSDAVNRSMCSLIANVSQMIEHWSAKAADGNAADVKFAELVVAKLAHLSDNEKAVRKAEIMTILYRPEKCCMYIYCVNKVLRTCVSVLCSLE